MYWRVVEQHTDSLSVALMDKDKDKHTAPEEVRKRQSSELAHLQQENKSLRKRLLNVETDLAGQRKLLQDSIGTKNRLFNEADREEILKTINSIKDAVANRPANSMEDFEKNVAALGEKVMSGNAALAKSEEVFRNSNKLSQTSTVKSTLLPQPQPSSNQQTTKPNRQSIASRFAKVFTSSKADNKPSNIAPRETERRNSRTADISTGPGPSGTSPLAFAERTHFSNEDFQ